jgi:dolichyl-diphosphooligosaccharide--protein glycosyltransferase
MIGATGAAAAPATPPAAAAPATRRPLAAALAVFVLALALRMLPAPLVLRSDGISFPAGADEAWHMRRIWYAVVNFPDSLPFDRYMNHPEGRGQMGPPAFDVAIAGLARLLVGDDDQVGAEWVAACVPPLLGAAAAATTLLAGWRAFGPGAGIAAGLLLAILPGHFFQSQVGLIDHHVLVTWLVALALLFGMAGLSGGRPPPAPRAFAALGLCLGALPAVSLAAFLHVPIVQAVLTAWVLGARERADARLRARRAALAMAAAVLPVLPFAFGPASEFGRFTGLAPSPLHPLYFAAAALAFAAVALLWRGAAGRTRFLRVVSAAAAAGAILVVALLAVPELSAGLGDAGGILGRADPVLVHGLEVQPLFWPLGPFSLGVAGTQLSLVVLVFPLVWLLLAGRSVRRREGADRWLLLVWSGASFALALQQMRFVIDLTVPFALVLGWAASLAAPALRRRIAARSFLGWTTAAAALAALALAFAPVGYCWVVQLREALAGQRAPNPVFVPGQLAEQAARWMRTGTPATSGFLDATQRPEYGVLSSWGVAHMIRYRAERPVVVDGRGSYGSPRGAEAAWAYYAAKDEAEALALLSELRVRYVVADWLGAGTGQGYAPGTMTDRLVRLLGSSGPAPGPGGAAVELPALAHHRLVFVARYQDPLRRMAPHVLGVFEVVPGVQVEGRAAPGARVEASLPLAAEAGFAHAYRTFTQADAQGRWSLRLPYGTDGVPGGAIRVGRHYTISAEGGARAELVVAESDVRAGSTVAGPRL